MFVRIFILTEVLFKILEWVELAVLAELEVWSSMQIMQVSSNEIKNQKPFHKCLEWVELALWEELEVKLWNNTLIW